jgi:hypothetical protein
VFCQHSPTVKNEKRQCWSKHQQKKKNYLDFLASSPKPKVAPAWIHGPWLFPSIDPVSSASVSSLYRTANGGFDDHVDDNAESTLLEWYTVSANENTLN